MNELTAELLVLVSNTESFLTTETPLYIKELLDFKLWEYNFILITVVTIFLLFGVVLWILNMISNKLDYCFEMLGIFTKVFVFLTICMGLIVF